MADKFYCLTITNLLHEGAEPDFYVFETQYELRKVKSEIESQLEKLDALDDFQFTEGELEPGWNSDDITDWLTERYGLEDIWEDGEEEENDDENQD